MKDQHKKDLAIPERASIENRADFISVSNCLQLYAGYGVLNPKIDVDVLKEAELYRADPENHKQVSAEATCISAGYTLLNHDPIFMETRMKAYDRKITDAPALLKANDEQRSKLIEGHQEFLGLAEMGKSGTRGYLWSYPTPFQ